jgi:hypothetical protein
LNAAVLVNDAYAIVHFNVPDKVIASPTTDRDIPLETKVDSEVSAQGSGREAHQLCVDVVALRRGDAT